MAEEAARAAKVWAGRLGVTTSGRVEAYTAGFDVDWRLLPDDIRASRAHATMLREAGLLMDEEHAAIDAALGTAMAEVGAGTFTLQPGDEDIHTALERRVTELAGDAGAKLHTGRSRNDQVATALRLYVLRESAQLLESIVEMQDALLTQARAHADSPMPGYTHLQRAQPVTLGHHLLAYVEMLQRDAGRVWDARTRADASPLGSGALAGSTLPLDRARTASLLGFREPCANTMDAVSDRDFVVELASACALLMTHMSRLGEEIVLWTSSEFGFAQLDDAHATGSSLMPQKKNPDVAELARGRTGQVTASVVSLLMMLKGLPLAYDRDMQEDKRALFAALDVTRDTLAVCAELVRGLRFDVAAMRSAASDPALLATDVAEHLVSRGVPFRDAHGAVGSAVRSALASSRTIADLDTREWQAVTPAADESIPALFDLDAALRRREVQGGPGPEAVRQQLERAAALIADSRRRLAAL